MFCTIFRANSYSYCEALSHCQIKHGTAAVMLNVLHTLSQNTAAPRSGTTKHYIYFSSENWSIHPPPPPENGEYGIEYTVLGMGLHFSTKSVHVLNDSVNYVHKQHLLC